MLGPVPSCSSGRYLGPTRHNYMNCPFCEAIDLGRTRDCGGGVHVLRDNYPISDGHLLVIPAVHAGSLSALDPDLVQRLFKVAAEEGIRMRSEGLCDDFNIGLNDGPMAGQTVPQSCSSPSSCSSGSSMYSCPGILRYFP